MLNLKIKSKMHDFFILSNFTLVFNGYYMILSGVSFFRLVYEIPICSDMHEHKKGLLLMKKYFILQIVHGKMVSI